MGYKIPDLPAASTPMTGNELLELWQGDRSKRVRLLDMLPGFDNTLAADLANTSDTGKGAAMVGGLIANSVTINVPADVASVGAAMDFLRNYTIARNAVATVQVADGTYSITGAIDLNHPQGDRIRILGNTTTPANCVLSNATGSNMDGLVASDGCVLGYIDGFTISRPTAGATGTGLLAVNGAFIKTGPNMRVANWYYGVSARNGASVQCRSIQVTGAGDVGIWAYNGGTIDCANAVSNGAADSTNDLGYGIQAEYGGSIDCPGASATGNRKAGIAALSGGIVRAHNCIASGNVGAGFLIRDQCLIAVNGSTCSNNGTWGVDRYGNGSVAGTYSGTGNTLGLQKSVAYFDNDTVAGSLRSNSGAPLRMGSNGSDGVWLEVSNNIALRCGTLGAGTAVNYIQVDAGLTGQPMEVKARGSDTNIDLQLSPKGTGNVRFGTLTANADAPVTGYITIKDAAGNVRKLAVIA